MKNAYIVIHKLDLDELRERVNERIGVGYVPVGGICVYVVTTPDGKDGYLIYYCQAMILRD